MDDAAERLHHNATLALAGTVPAAVGEEAIAALLRSSVEIDPIMRDWLADALAPRGKRPSNVRLRLTNLEEGKFAREMRTKTTMLKRGNRALRALERGLSWDAALAEAASECGCSAQSIEKGVTYARRYQEWCAAYDGDRSEKDAGFHAWRTTFHVAAIEGRDPGELWARQMRALDALEAKRST
ncbi:MAG: hypothetical protein H6920_05045 [Sphingomonadaceae bacterium]|nr:hypothetical protein [Sphingomonadaceae bacterium]MCP5394720.1 hypothetical protein [Sphingomonadaceae bacterium]